MSLGMSGQKKKVRSNLHTDFTVSREGSDLRAGDRADRPMKRPKTNHEGPMISASRMPTMRDRVPDALSSRFFWLHALVLRSRRRHPLN